MSLDDLMREIVQAKDPKVFERPEFQNTPTLSEYLSMLMSGKGVTQAELRRELLLERTYAYQLFNGIRKPTRRQLLCIAVFLRLTVEETQCLLNIGQRCPLYPRRHFDALVLYALCNHMNIEETDELLSTNGENTLVK